MGSDNFWWRISNLNLDQNGLSQSRIINDRGGWSGCIGCAILHLMFIEIAIFIRFQSQKNFENRSKIGIQSYDFLSVYYYNAIHFDS